MSDNDPSWPGSGEGDSTPPPPPPPPPPGAPAAGGQSTAGATLGVRFGARFIDGIIVGIVGAILSTVLGFGTYLSGIVSLILGLAYYAFLDSSRGATFGKQLLGLSVQGAGGGLPTIEESLKRNAFYLLGLLPTLIGSLVQLAAVIYIAVTINSDEANQGAHDKFAGGTRVVRG